MNASLDDTSSNFNVTGSSFSVMATFDFNEQNELIIKSEVEMDNTGEDPFLMSLFEADDNFPEDKDPLRLDETDDCGDTYSDLDVKEEPLSPQLRSPEQEPEVTTKDNFNEKSSSHSSETNANPEKANDSKCSNKQEFRVSSETLVTQQHAKRNENSITYYYSIHKETAQQERNPNTPNEPQTVESKNQCNISRKDKLYKCDTFGKAFSGSNLLRQHKRIHSREIPSRPHKCNYCEKCFTTTNYLKIHESIHTGEKPYECDTCAQCFSGPGDLKSHKRSHRREKTHKCNYCEKCFVTANIMKVHERIHTGEKPYKCESCGKGFCGLKALGNHKRGHSEEKPHKCNYCEKRCVTLYSLKLHQKIHTREKPDKLICDICGKSFPGSSDLNRHKKIHAEERRHKCSFCDKSFSTALKLGDHERIHTGEEPYECGICRRTFSVLSNLKRHQKNSLCRQAVEM